MAAEARVTSVEALELFRAQFIVYLDKAKSAVDEIHDEVLRTRVWLQNDRGPFWQMELRRRQRKLEEAQQELLTARIGNLREASAAQQMAVRRAKEAVVQAEEKITRIKQWIRDYDSRVEPLGRSVDKLRDVLAVDMERGVMFLNGAIESLHAYAQAGLEAAAPEKKPEAAS
jgi:chromosome segregation ATPase